MSYDLSTLEKGCESLNITLSAVQKQQFLDFYEYLVEKNKVMNLTGITEFEEVLVKHFLDSLACVKAVDMSKIQSFMDCFSSYGSLSSGFSEKKSEFSGGNLSASETSGYPGSSWKSRGICKK